MLIELTTKLNFETNTPPVEAMAPDCSNSDHQPIDDDEDIVITGMSGRYPSCANLEEFWNGLVAGRELAEINDKRWPIGYFGLPKKHGVIPDADRFDAEFFGFPEAEATDRDPLTKKLLETTTEAFIDGAFNKEDLKDQNTGLFVGWCHEDQRGNVFPNLDRLPSTVNLVLADTARGLGLVGPIMGYDTACASAFSAMHEAVQFIRSGVCDSAVVAGATINSSVFIANSFRFLGMTSIDGKSKCMDRDADGYCRSEAVVSILLQKKKNAKRVYAKVLETNSNNDGFKQEGITFPSVNGQINLMKEVYAKAGVDPTSVNYVEAHMTGTQAGDPTESQAIYEVMCKDRPATRPLLVGCLKSNMGHSEGASGVAAVTKSCLIFQKNWIPPNIKYENPNPKIEGLKDGSLKPVEMNTQFNDNLIALNCFGFGGSNAHVILERNYKRNNPTSTRITNSPSFPRIINLCSRNEEGIHAILGFFKTNPTQITRDFLALLNDYSKMNQTKMTTRCSLLMDENHHIQWMESSRNSRPLVLFFPDVSVQEKSFQINPDLMEIKPFYESFKENLEYLTKRIPTIESFQTALIYQMALIDLIKLLGIEPKKTFGQGSGHLMKNYFDSGLSRKMVLASIINHNISSELAHDSDPSAENLLTLEVTPFNSSQPNKISLMPFDSVPKDFLNCLGTIYINGTNVAIEELYPKVQYPVAQETASLSPLIKWNHDKIYPLAESVCLDLFKADYHVDLAAPQFKFLAGHVIDGRILFPATGYLWIVREFFLQMNLMDLNSVIEFKNIILSRATILAHNTPVVLRLFIDKSTGKFNISEGGSECVSGFINSCPYKPDTENLEPTIHSDSSEEVILSQTDVYKELRICGYDYSGSFQGITTASTDGTRGTVKWTGHWISFADCLAQITALRSNRQLIIPTSIDYMKVDIETLTKEIETNPSQEFAINFDYDAQIGWSKGLFIKGLKGSPITRKFQKVLAEEYHFVPFDQVIQRNDEETKKIARYYSYCSKLARSVSLNEPLHEDMSKEIQDEFEQNSNYSLLKSLFNYYVSKMKSSLDPLVLAGDFFATLYESEDRMIRNMVEIVVENFPFTKPFDVIQVTSSSRSEEHLFDDARILKLKTLNYQTLPSKLEEIPNLKNNSSDLIAFKDPNASFEYIAGGQNESLNSMDFLEAVSGHLNEGQFVMMIFRSMSHGFEGQLCDHLAIQAPVVVSTNKVVSRATELGFVKICLKEDPTTGIVTLLLRKAVQPTAKVIVNMETSNQNWVTELQNAIKENSESEKPENIWLTSSDSNSGILGFMKCLQKETNSVRALFCPGKNGLTASVTDQLEKMDLAINVYENNSLGSYRHKSESLDTKALVKDAYLDVETKGDLSSLKYYEENGIKFGNKIKVHYSALNFKDVMVASGRIPLSVYPDLGGNLGMEFSGTDHRGDRVMAIVPSLGIGSSVDSDRCITWKVPDHMSLEDAASIPVAYMTVYYSLVIRGKLIKGESVLIHSGTGGVGQAALNVCISIGCDIFTTVGSEEKKQFILKNFPEVKEDQILNSRKPDFEYDVLRKTKGRGVDVILNSLTGEMLKASIRCLAEFGRFLEIGKYDMIRNSPFDMTDFWHNRTFEVCCLAHLMALDEGTLNKMRDFARKLLQDGLDSGVVKPLPTHVFDQEKSEDAFRFMASGKHMGKVLIKFRDEVKASQKDLMVPSVRTLHFDPNKSYVIIGGLGGMGLELGLWLLMKGAKHLILTSRSGVRTSYHKMAIKRFESYGGTIWVSKLDVSRLDQTTALIIESEKIAPVGAIFNLALQLSDSSFENQTVDKFNDVCSAKVNGTTNLDMVSRELCKELDHFVCFSSIVSGLGNGGQSNYGFASSVMERICQERKKDRLPALAIQWGVIGDVGIVAETMNFTSLGVFTAQRIKSVFDTLGQLMLKDGPVYLAATVKDTLHLKSGEKGDLLKVICHVLGVKDSNSLQPNVTLGDLGMDSLMAIEIRQGLERDYDVVMTAQEIRALTIAEIKELGKLEKKSSEKGSSKDFKYKFSFEESTEIFIQLNTNTIGKPVFLFPGIEGNFGSLFPVLGDIIDRPIYGINWITRDGLDPKNMKEFASFYMNEIKEQFPDTSYSLMGFSFGGLVCLEVAIQMQQKFGPECASKILLLDSSPEFMMKTAVEVEKRSKNNNSMGSSIEDLSANLIISLLPAEYSDLMDRMKDVSPKERMAVYLKLLKDHADIETSEDELKSAAKRNMQRIKMARSYLVPNGSFKGDIRLIRSTYGFDPKIQITISDDYGLKKVSEGSVEVIKNNGFHRTFLAECNEKVARDIASFHVLSTG